MILTKIYEDESRIEKIKKIVDFYVNKIGLLASFEEGSGYFLLKSSLFIYQMIRRSPSHDYLIWDEVLHKITHRATTLPFLLSFCKIIKAKIEFHEKFGQKIEGNFYFRSLETYFMIESDDVFQLSRYCEKLIIYVGKMAVHSKLNEHPFKIVLLEICNEIYNSISVLLFLILAMKKDNKLGLRNMKIEMLENSERQI